MAPNRPGWNTGQTQLAQVGSDVATEAPDGILRQELSGRPVQSCKNTQNRARLEFRTRLAQVGSDVATEAPEGIFEQGQQLPTANSSPKVAVVVVFRKESWIDPICKKTVQTVINFDPTGQSGCFFFLGLNRWVFLGFHDSLTP
ncbi:hypothetical protein CRG98_027327 [Punica granatum]|uniref:Uncharacterized protein n=1 Tax=Punica granatum TaxID=22663 RepID=A0A2I0J7S1_PUNGR|nr:hypothetical protein CRG98_027327 [Punica granatum]